MCEGQDGRSQAGSPGLEGKTQAVPQPGVGAGTHPLQTGGLSAWGRASAITPQGPGRASALDMLKVKISLLPRPVCTHMALFSKHTQQPQSVLNSVPTFPFIILSCKHHFSFYPAQLEINVICV